MLKFIALYDTSQVIMKIIISQVTLLLWFCTEINRWSTGQSPILRPLLIFSNKSSETLELLYVSWVYCQTYAVSEGHKWNDDEISLLIAAHSTLHIVYAFDWLWVHNRVAMRAQTFNNANSKHARCTGEILPPKRSRSECCVVHYIYTYTHTKLNCAHSRVIPIDAIPPSREARPAARPYSTQQPNGWRSSSRVNTVALKWFLHICRVPAPFLCSSTILMLHWSRPIATAADGGMCVGGPQQRAKLLFRSCECVRRWGHARVYFVLYSIGLVAIAKTSRALLLFLLLYAIASKLVCRTPRMYDSNVRRQPAATSAQ